MADCLEADATRELLNDLVEWQVVRLGAVIVLRAAEPLAPSARTAAELAAPGGVARGQLLKPVDPAPHAFSIIVKG